MFWFSKRIFLVYYYFNYYLRLKNNPFTYYNLDLSYVNYNKYKSDNEKSSPNKSLFNLLMNNYYESKKISRTQRIVFAFTVSARNDRQIMRVLKRLYHPLHFYYFHVDEVIYFLLNWNFMFKMKLSKFQRVRFIWETNSKVQLEICVKLKI